MKQFEYLDHTADIIVKGSGDTLAEAFAAVGEGMIALMTHDAPVARAKSKAVAVDAIDRESLLVTFLSQLLLVFEVERFVPGEITVEFSSGTSLTAQLVGELFDRDRHGQGIPVKGVSYHLLEIHDATDGHPCWVQVLLDI
ncbi:MAG: archease [Candidatus Zixiibacteriota bacterium]|nr:MAG: archease [candidate division Zixibacteria bacterium]